MQSIGRDPMTGEMTDDPTKSSADRGGVGLSMLTNQQAKAPSTVGRPGGASPNSTRADANVNLRNAAGISGPGVHST